VSGAGAYTFSAFALQAASFWIHIHASLLALLRRPGRFVVTPKQGSARRQPGAVAPGLLLLLVLVGTAAYGLSRDRTPATLNNVAFALLHMSVLTAGVRPALRRGGGVQAQPAAEEEPATPSEVAAAA
jgi:cellulose synthase (UDP-forming)